MKVIFLLYVALISLSSNIFCQCPQSGLKFQTSTCEMAKDLKLTSITCSEIKVIWQGNYNQKYIVKATSNNSLSNRVTTTNISDYSVDPDGNFQAVISVKPGNNINWSVQGICMQSNGTLNNYSLSGPQAYIPYCDANPSAIKTLKAYPNPTTGELFVEYNGEISPNTSLTISDVSGKNVFPVSASAVTRLSNGYQLNVHNLVNGTYFLKIINGKDVSQVKFVLLKN